MERTDAALLDAKQLGKAMVRPERSTGALCAAAHGEKRGRPTDRFRRAFHRHR
ncbi:MAG: hypothetical protein IPL15_10180 [Comamonadaceae bacterium]|uniref:hypothetical protein n=1 Tax=Candidatus Skiveiella danica TaxID=3386177 RepID=UPI00390B7854|nr:hypothetical protein [Comamonadaceae bacterium]